MIRRHYVDGRYGQIHLRENAPIDGVPLVCLHATAYSSRSFTALLAALDGRRHVIALDTPGYGESDAPPAPIAMAGYADALSEVCPDHFDLFGYHTGVAIAAEMANGAPARIGRLTLMGIPYFQALDFAGWRARLAARHRLGGALDQFDERWRFLVTERPAGLSLQRGYENFVDELKAWPDGWWAHDALFEHDLATCLAGVTQPVTVLNPPGHLFAPSRLAAALMRDATLIDLPDLAGAVLDGHADTIARFLMSPETIAASGCRGETPSAHPERSRGT